MLLAGRQDWLGKHEGAPFISSQFSGDAAVSISQQFFDIDGRVPNLRCPILRSRTYPPALRRPRNAFNAPGMDTDQQRRTRCDHYPTVTRHLANRYFGMVYHCLQHRIHHDDDLAFPPNKPLLDKLATCDVFVQNIRRSHYELAADAPPNLRVAADFNEFAQAV